MVNHDQTTDMINSLINLSISLNAVPGQMVSKTEHNLIVDGSNNQISMVTMFFTGLVVPSIQALLPSWFNQLEGIFGINM